MIDRTLRLLEGISEATGRWVAWCGLAVVLVVFAVVVLRYLFGTGWAWLQELYLYLHGAAFMLGAAYTLKRDGHVRIDVAYGRFGRRYRAWVDLFGSLLLLAPVVGWLLYVSLPFVADSWGRLEGSRQSGGLPGVFILKSIIPVTCALLLGQAAAAALRAVVVLRRRDAEAG